MASVVALMDDRFQAKVSGTAKVLGIELRTLHHARRFVAAEIAEHPPKLVVVDLNSLQQPDSSNREYACR